MQSKISFFNPTIYKKNLTRFWPFALLYLVCLILLHPLVIYTEYAGYQYYEDYRTPSMIVMEHFANRSEPVSIFIASIVIAIAVFSYLYQSRSANMIHAFPVTRTQLFVTNYLSGLTLLVLAQFLGALSTNFIILGKANSEIWIVWAWFGMNVLETLFFYSFAVFMVMFTGQLLAAGVFYLIWSFLYIVVISLINSCVSLFIYGLDEELISQNIHPLFPLAYLIDRVGFSTNSEITACNVYGMGIAGIYAIVGLVFAVLAWWIYKKRRIECAGDFLSMKWTAPVFRWGVGIVGGVGCALYVTYLFYDGFGSSRTVQFVISLLIFCSILFFAAEMFIEKSFRVFHKKLAVECGCLVVVMLIGVSLLHFDAFGVEGYVPDAEDVTMISMSWNYDYVAYEDTAHVKQLCELHQTIVDNLDEIKGSSNDAEEPAETYYAYVSFTYTLEDGAYVSRSYAIQLTDQQLSTQLNGQLEQLTNDADGCLSAVLGLNFKELNWQISYMSISVPVEDAETGSMYYGPSQEISGEKNQQLIYDAWLADIADGAFTDSDASSLDGSLTIEFKTDASAGEIRYPKGSTLPYMLDEYSATDSVSAYQDILLNDQCTHLIEALKTIGVISDVSDLMIPVE